MCVGSSVHRLIMALSVICMLTACMSSAADQQSPPPNGEAAAPVAEPPPEEWPLFQIVPLGQVDETHLAMARQAIEETFYARVIVTAPLPLPPRAFVKSRGRWRAEVLLEELRLRKEPGALKVIGLTDRDICTADPRSSCWGIFGLGALGGESAVISTWRLGVRTNNPRLHSRLAKVVVHEIGHTFGLEHCPTAGCLMQDAQGTIVTVDNEEVWCPVCREKLNRRLRPNSRFMLEEKEL